MQQSSSYDSIFLGLTSDELEGLKNKINNELNSRINPYQDEVDFIYQLRKQYKNCCGNGFNDIHKLLCSISSLNKKEMEELIEYVRRTYPPCYKERP